MFEYDLCLQPLAGGKVTFRDLFCLPLFLLSFFFLFQFEEVIRKKVHSHLKGGGESRITLNKEA